MRNIIIIIISLVICISCQNIKNQNASVFRAQKLYRKGTVIPAGYEYPNQKEFSVLTWNVEHFLDPFDDPYIENDRENNPRPTMAPRISPFLNALRTANADLVVLQEFESAKYLRKLAKDSLGNMGYLYFADAPSHTWYMNVVVMSKFPLGTLHSYGNVTTPVENWVDTLGRVQTQNRLNTRMWSMDVFPQKNYSFELTGLHLKAGRGDRNIGMRTGQINLLKSHFEQVLQDDPTRNILVVGDLNATPNSQEIKLLLKKTGDNDLMDPLGDDIYTHPADNVTRRLDYMLPNQHMAKELKQVEVKLFYDAQSMRVISDHLPIIGSFSVKEE